MRFWRCESGATAIEYGLMVALLAMTIVGAMGLIGTRWGVIYDAISQKLT